MITDIKLVAEREIREKLHNRGFLALTALMVILLPAGVLVSSTLRGEGTKTYTVATVGTQASELAHELQEYASARGADLELTRVADRSAAEKAVRTDEVDVAIVGESTVLADGGLDGSLGTLLQRGVSRLRSIEALREAGVTGSRLRTALDPTPLTVTDVSRGSGFGSIMIAVFGSVLLFVALYLYGYWVATGVVEEKSSRVIELMLATIRPSRLLAGKVIGIGALGLAQLAVSIVIGLVAAVVVGITLPPATIASVVSVLLWFVVGFALYSCIFAVAGSIVSKQEDTQYTQMPPMLLILAGYMIAVQYVQGGLDPTLVHGLAYVPPFTPVLMPVLLATGEVAVWEVAVTAVLTCLAGVGLIGVASRLYKGSVLRFGGRVSLREAWG